MKKFMSVFLVLVLAFSLVACQNNDKELEKDNIVEEKNENENNEPKEILYLADNFASYAINHVIRLQEMPSSGYSWQYKIDDESVAVIEEDEFVQNEAPEGMTGVGGLHSFKVVGVSQGETKITFKYLRSWEDESTAIKELTFDLKVNENNEISIVEK